MSNRNKRARRQGNHYTYSDYKRGKKRPKPVEHIKPSKEMEWGRRQYSLNPANNQIAKQVAAEKRFIHENRPSASNRRWTGGDAFEPRAKNFLTPRKDVLTGYRLFFQDVKDRADNVKAFFKKNTWAKRMGLMGVGLITFRFAIHPLISALNSQQRVIPKEYERGYDIIREQLTDFGSPLILSKAAQKVIIPYYSSVRSGIRTTVQSQRNLALRLHDNAIGHTRY